MPPDKPHAPVVMPVVFRVNAALLEVMLFSVKFPEPEGGAYLNVTLIGLLAVLSKVAVNFTGLGEKVS